MDRLPSYVPTVIVGSGFAGLCAAVKLREAGLGEFLVIERGGDVGGTWRDNTYPGCACDVPSHLYSFSFAQSARWRHAFSRQPQILDYLREVAREHDLTPTIRFNTCLEAATWNPTSQRWQVHTNVGSLSCDRLILGVGPLSDPSIPQLPGLESFRGTTFHSAAWRHDHDLTGDRVAVVGTGASAIQFVPQVQQPAAHLTLFQRTAPWVLPRRDRPYHRVERWLNRWLPGLQRATRLRMYALRELWLVGFVVRPSLMKYVERLALRHLESQIPDPHLRAALTPRFRLGCKRVLLSNDYYPALNQPNVDVVTDPIVQVDDHAVVTMSPDGVRRRHVVDTVIFGTGFRVTDMPVFQQVRGRDGRSLADHWADAGMSALYGTTVAGFPNLFLLVGPNTGLGHNSIVLMIEAQVRYLVDLLTKASASGVHEIEPRREVQDRYNSELQRRLQRTVWNSGGCRSWYLDAQGRNTTLWPTFTFTFMRRLRRADLADYQLRPRLPLREVVPA